jgi:hypothetical protein
MKFWRSLYWILGWYDSYPSDKPDSKQMYLKKQMLDELKEMKYRAELFENKIKFTDVVVELKCKKNTPATPPSSPVNSNSPLEVKRFLNVSMILEKIADEKKISYI